ncbi:MAG: hypothetical protein DMF64_02080 [Acidobacteria bacterium]|nr:MAG: hypothetical protein DMF64_02080 [Acidobacteriota bacterium]
MRLTAEAQAHVERFFRVYLRDERLSLPAISVHTDQLAHVITGSFRIGAITFGRHVFVAPTLLVCDVDERVCVPGWLVAHEAMHVIQYERAGMARFLFAYLREYARARRRGKSFNAARHWVAYRAIAHEVEARAAEAAYCDWTERAEMLTLI